MHSSETQRGAIRGESCTQNSLAAKSRAYAILLRITHLSREFLAFSVEPLRFTSF